jgi:hypothetical protein
MLAGEQPAGTAKTGGNFIGDQQHLVPVTQRACTAQVVRCIEAHTTSALHYRFQYQCGQLVRVRFQRGIQ